MNEEEEKGCILSDEEIPARVTTDEEGNSVAPTRRAQPEEEDRATPLPDQEGGTRAGIDEEGSM